MDQLERAQRRYRQLLPQPVTDWHAVPMDGLRVWVQDDVGPVVEAYGKRPAFKDHATWPLRVLTAGSGSAERGLIELVDAGLVRSARALLALARQQTVWRQMQALYPARHQVTSETVAVSGAGIRCLARTREAVDELPRERAQVEQIAQRFWSDLVCAGDYFAPLGGWMERAAPAAHDRAWERPRSVPTAGAFVVELNPALHPIGDFVTRCLLRRVGILFDLLGAFRRKCLAAVQKVGRARPLEAERALWQELSAGLQHLEKACMLGADAQRRDSCVILTQAYAAFDRAPNIAWLGLPAEAIAAGVPQLRHRFLSKRNGDMMDRIAAALGDLRNLYEGGAPRQAALEEAIASGGLVLVEASREAYWEGQRLAYAWRNYPARWELLWQLATKAVRQAVVVDRDLGPNSGSLSRLPTTWSRLSEMLPASLSDRVEAVRGERGYRLDLPRQRIHFF